MAFMVAPTVLLAGVFLSIALRTQQKPEQPASEQLPLAALLPSSLGAEGSLPQADQKMPGQKRTTVVAVGDIMLSRNVGAIIRKKKDVNYPYADTRDFTRGADIAFANLETSITPGRPIVTGEMTFRADPETVNGLADAGFDVVSLANNHTPNFGQKGLADTFKYLRDAGIAYAGAGQDYAAAPAPAIVERNGLRFAFLAYNDHDVVPESYAAADGHAGTAIMQAVAVTAGVKAARAVADVVIVSMHSGHEYAYVPNKAQVEFAHAAIDAGADLVIGHHAHVVQTVERYGGKMIFYGLGNFIFDQQWSVPTREGMAVRITFEGSRVTAAEAFPVYVTDAKPTFSEGLTADETLAHLAVPAKKTEHGFLLDLPEPPLP